MVLLKVAVPKFRLLMTPQKSPVGPKSCCLRVAEVAVGVPVAVAVGPRPRDVGGNARRRVAERRSSTP